MLLSILSGCGVFRVISLQPRNSFQMLRNPTRKNFVFEPYLSYASGIFCISNNFVFEPYLSCGADTFKFE